jgi:preprotein translocase subunit SecA
VWQAVRTLATLVPVATQDRLGIMHYPVQIAAGLALLDGHIVQLATGEGKTIVGLYPEVIFGLLAQIDREVRARFAAVPTHRSVHVVTANPLLTERDTLWLAPVLAWFDLKTSRLDHLVSIAEQVAANQAEVVFGTASDFVFVHLYAETATHTGERGTGTPFVLLVDEVDHSFIDEATTPFVVTEGNGEAERDVHIVYHLGRLAQELAAEPGLFVLPSNDEEAVHFSKLGVIAVDALVAEMLEEKDEEAGGEDETAINDSDRESEAKQLGALTRVCSVLLRRMADLLIHQGVEQSISQQSDQRLLGELQTALATLFGSFKMGATSGEIMGVLRGLFGARNVLLEILQEEGLTKQEFESMRRFILRDLKIIALLRGRPGPALGLFTTLLQTFAESQARTCLQTEPGRLAGHIRACIRLFLELNAPDGNGVEHWPEGDVLAALDQRLAQLGVTARMPGPIAAFGADLDHFWIQPLFRVLRDQSNPKLRELYRFMRLLLAMFVRMSRTVRPSSSRDIKMAQLGHDVGRLLSHPMLFTFDIDTQRTTLEAAGRALLRRYLSGFLSRDLWPGVDGPATQNEPTEFSRFVSSVETMLTVGLRAHLFLQRDNDYVVRASERGGREVVIVSDLTGFSLPGRRWSGLLHAFVEQKEGLPVLPEATTRNRISMQRFAQRYARVIGMSATVEEAADEFLSVYGAQVRVFEPNVSQLAYAATSGAGIPLSDPLAPSVVLTTANSRDVVAAGTAFLAQVDSEVERGSRRRVTLLSREIETIEMACKWLAQKRPGLRLTRGWMSNRREMKDLVYRSKAGKEAAVAELVAEAHEKGMPILVETASVRDCEHYHDLISKRVPYAKIQRLDARNEGLAAEILSLAGRSGVITIATQMAGRGVDIILQPEAVQAGGLLVASTERRDSRRWDRQIAGRAARQGDPGFSQFFLSLEDDLIRSFGGDRVIGIMDRLKMEDAVPIAHPLINSALASSQARTEAVRRASREQEYEIDNHVQQVRQHVMTLRALAVGDSHRCSFDSPSDRHPIVKNTAPSPLCPRCLAAQRTDDGRPSPWLRTPVRDVVSEAIEDALRPALPEHDLTQRFAPEDALPPDWNLDGIARELTEMIGARVEVNDIATTIGWRDEVHRAAVRLLPGTGGIYRPIVALKEWATRRDDEQERLRLVNRSELWAPDVERKVLRRRIRELLQEASLRRFMALVDKVLLARPRSSATSDLVAPVIESLRRDPEGQFQELAARMERDKAGWYQIDSVEEFRTRCRGFVDEHGPALMPVLTADSTGYARLRVVKLMAPLTANKASHDAPAGASLRAWAQRCVDDWYCRAAEMGKPELYAAENRLLREIIDEAYSSFLSQIELQRHRLRFKYAEDRLRSYSFTTAELHEELCVRIGKALIAKWPSIRAATNRKVGPSGPTLWRTPLDDCGCGSSLPYHTCCGTWLHGEVGS